MTEAELVVTEALAVAWNAFLTLPVEHEDDCDEFRRIIHAAQEKILCRSARRQINEKVAVLFRQSAGQLAEVFAEE